MWKKTMFALHTICISKTTKKQANHQDFSECVCVCLCGCFEESGADKSSDTLRSCSFGEDSVMYCSKCRSSLSTTKFGFSFSRRFAMLDLFPAFGKSFMRTYFKFLKYKTRWCSYLLVHNDLLMVSSIWHLHKLTACRQTCWNIVNPLIRMQNCLFMKVLSLCYNNKFWIRYLQMITASLDICKLNPRLVNKEII